MAMNFSSSCTWNTFEANARPTEAIRPTANTSMTGVMIWLISYLLPYENIPPNPIKLRDMMAAVSRTIGTPWKDFGIRL